MQWHIWHILTFRPVHILYVKHLWIYTYIFANLRSIFISRIDYYHWRALLYEHKNSWVIFITCAADVVQIFYTRQDKDDRLCLKKLCRFPADNKLTQYNFIMIHVITKFHTSHFGSNLKQFSCPKPIFTSRILDWDKDNGSPALVLYLLLQFILGRLHHSTSKLPSTSQSWLQRNILNICLRAQSWL